MESLYKVYRDDLLHLNDVQEKKSLIFSCLATWSFFFMTTRFFPTRSCDSEGPDQPWVSCGLLASPFLFSLQKKMIGWCPFIFGGGGEGDEYWFAAHFCKALFITHRCRKLNFDDVFSWEGGCRRWSPSHKKGENEALLPQERDLIGLSLEVKCCCHVICRPVCRRAGGRRVRCSDRSFCQRGSARFLPA